MFAETDADAVKTQIDKYVQAVLGGCPTEC